MAAQLNHTIVWSSDQMKSSQGPLYGIRTYNAALVVVC